MNFIHNKNAKRLTPMTQAVGAVLIASVGVSAAFASSHREAPNITRYPTLDSSDFYMFSSYETGRDAYVTIIANYTPLQDAYGGPNYFALDPAAKYNIHIDNNGDAVEDLTFQFDFAQTLGGAENAGAALTIGDKTVAVPLKNIGGISAGVDNAATLNFNETYSVNVITGPAATGTMAPVTVAGGGSATFTKPYDYIGDKTFTDATAYAAYANQYRYEIDIPNCATPGRVFVGQRKDSFSVNLGETFDLVNYTPTEGGTPNEAVNNDLADKNVTSIAMEIPKSCLTSGAEEPVIGGWTTAQIPQVRIQNPQATFEKPEVNGGALTQISRLGMPLVNELVIGLPDKDAFSASMPKDDAQFADYVTNPTLPALLDTLFRDAFPGDTNIAPDNFPRADIVATFLTGISGVNQPSVFAQGQTAVMPSEMLRLNTSIAATAPATQNNLGVLGGDNAGFPNGRRPGDDVVDASLRVVMGALCHVPSLNLCTTANAPVGDVPFADGAPISASDFDVAFPYVTTPIPGSTN